MKEFLKKHEKFLFEILRFLLVGGLATIIDYIVFELSYNLIFITLDEMINLALSTALGFLFGNIFNYIFSIIFVFKGAKENKKTQTIGAFLLFTLIGVIGLGIKIGCQTGGTYLMNLIYNPSSNFGIWFKRALVYGVATLIVLVWNYTCRKLLIFKGDENK